VPADTEIELNVEAIIVPGICEPILSKPLAEMNLVMYYWQLFNTLYIWFKHGVQHISVLRKPCVYRRVRRQL